MDLETPHECESGNEELPPPSVSARGIFEGCTSSSTRPGCSQWSNGVGRDPSQQVDLLLLEGSLALRRRFR